MSILLTLAVPDDLVSNLGKNQLQFFFANEDAGLGKVSISEQEHIEALETSPQLKLILPAAKAENFGSRKRPSQRNSKLAKAISEFQNQSKTPRILSAAQQTSPNFFQQDSIDFISASQSLDTGKSSSCKFCCFEASLRQNLVRRVNLKHVLGTPSLNCTICEHTTKLKENMKKHYMGKHKLPEAMARAALI